MLPELVNKFAYLTFVGHILLSPDEGMTTLFPQVESMLTTQDSRGMLHENRMVITITDRILQVMKMVLNRTKMEVVMLSEFKPAICVILVTVIFIGSYSSISIIFIFFSMNYHIMPAH